MVLKFQEYGKYYGYPPCCIHAFIQRFRRNEKPSDMLRMAGQGTGFIPCEYHAERILSNKMRIDECISPDRQCEKPFCGFIRSMVH